jgi:hypothetical protein
MVASRVLTSLHFGPKWGSRVKIPLLSGSGLTYSSSIKGWLSGRGHSRVRFTPAERLICCSLCLSSLSSSSLSIGFSIDHSGLLKQFGQRGKVRGGAGNRMNDGRNGLEAIITNLLSLTATDAYSI